MFKMNLKYTWDASLIAWRTFENVACLTIITITTGSQQISLYCIKKNEKLKGDICFM